MTERLSTTHEYLSADIFLLRSSLEILFGPWRQHLKGYSVYLNMIFVNTLLSLCTPDFPLTVNLLINHSYPVSLFLVTCISLYPQRNTLFLQPHSPVLTMFFWVCFLSASQFHPFVSVSAIKVPLFWSNTHCSLPPGLMPISSAIGVIFLRCSSFC